MANGRNFPISFRSVAGAAALAAMLMATGCQQASNDPSYTGALDTGTYPNLNVKPGVANQQLSAQQAQASKAQLESAATANAGRSGAVPNDQAYLKRLAAQHEREALEKIENAQ